MAMDVATLGLAVDSSGVVKGASALNNLSAASEKAETATLGVTNAASRATAALNGQATAATKAAAAANFSNSSRNMAMQLSQVAQQTMAAGNFIQALSIQIPDMALGFGTLGIAIGVAAGVLLPFIANMFSFGDAVSGVSSRVQDLAAQAASLSSVASALENLHGLQKKYAEAIANSAKAQASATASILANTEKEFNAKKSLLELEVKRQEAAVAVQRAELAAVGAQLKAQISRDVTNPVNNISGGYSDPLIGDFVRNPNTEGVIEKTRALIENSGLGDKITEIRAQIDLTEASTNVLRDALNTTFKGGVANADVIKTAFENAAKGAKKTEDAYGNLVEGANRRIASMKAEQAALGMTEQASLQLKYETELLNQAKQKDITLTAAQKAELSGLAAEMASTEIATRNAREAMDFAKDATSGFLSTLRQGLVNGEGWWKSLGNAANSVLDKIASKIEEMFVNSLFESSSGGILSSLFGGLFGGSTGGSVGSNANGTNGWRGGLTMVGERGPELISLPTGSKVIPNHRMSQGGQSSMDIRLVWDADDGINAKIENAKGDIVKVTTAIQRAGLETYRRNNMASDVKRINKDPRRTG